MERENNLKEYKGTDEELPKFGAGSEFGREAKEEARRKKLGIIARKYKPDDQPWILKTYGSTVKKFKGIREGGVSENTAYYVFTHAENHAIEAYPLQEWYKFQPIQRYKTLSAEEAEQEFNNRNKHLNFFSLMLRKRLKGEDDDEEDAEEKGKKSSSSKKSKELQISEMDEWMDTSDEESSEEEKKEEEEEQKEDKKKKKKVVPKKKKRDTDGEAFEESDDGDSEGKELDYISDSSNSEADNVNLESVAEEKALRKLLTSDEGSSDSEKSEKEQSNEDDENKDKESEKAENGDKDKKKKNKKKLKKDPKDPKKEKNDSNSDFSSDSSSDEETKKKKLEKKAKKEEKESNSTNSSRCTTPVEESNKRKIVHDALAGPSMKKHKLDSHLSSYMPVSSESGITEDAVRKYLMRKPMTTTELLQKFKSKKTGLSGEQLVNVMTLILKKINPIKQTTQGKMYLSIKP